MMISFVSYSLTGILLIVLCLRTVPTTLALSGLPAIQQDNGTAVTKQSFHKVLEAVGKTVFRPGGTQATERLHEWSELNHSHKALELASGLGKGGIALALKQKCHVVLTDIDPDRLEAAAKAIQENDNLQNLVSVRRLDMRQMDLAKSDVYDAVLVEASLTHEPLSSKENILKQIHPHCRQILLHEIYMTRDDPTISKTVGETLAIGFHPLTKQGWQDVLQVSGFEISEVETGPIEFLKPSGLLQDEGPLGAAKIGWNLATRKDLRDRVLSTKSVLKAHDKGIGYIIIKAVPK